ncbi:TPA: helix-turn-helix domain-containing protein [Enterobacter asburiae]
MKNRLNYIEEIQNLLTLKGVGERKHASTMASILGIQYNSAKQKLDGKRGITLEEIKSIFKYFGVSFTGQRHHNCVFIMNSIHKRCNITVDPNPVIEKEEGIQYASEKDGMYIIDVNDKCNADSSFFRVLSIDFLSPPKVAILDNDEDILNLTSRICHKYGFYSDTYKNKDDLLTALKEKEYEAYILDWLLDYNITADDVIKNIRSKDNNTPIMLLTGQVNHYEKNISEMIMYHNVYLIEKPARTLIISSFLLSHIIFI